MINTKYVLAAVLVCLSLTSCANNDNKKRSTYINQCTAAMANYNYLNWIDSLDSYCECSYNSVVEMGYEKEIRHIIKNKRDFNSPSYAYYESIVNQANRKCYIEEFIKKNKTLRSGDKSD